ncbi:uncharacterized protein DS421_13g410250 [Arachis hypogaea]|nr:uncharacterized protein DS421_13g410250 [Arachis hypogaea]
MLMCHVLIALTLHPYRLLPQHHLLTKAELSHLYHRGSVALAQALSLSRLRSLYYLQCRTQARRQSSPSRTQLPSRAFLVAAGPGTDHRRRSLSRHRLTLNPAPLLPLLRLSPAAAETTGSRADRRCCLLASTLAINFLFTVSFLPAVSFLPGSWSPIW